MEHDEYTSPFSNRYGGENMRKIWGEKYKRACWRRVWSALAYGMSEVGMIQVEHARAIARHEHEIDVARSLELEKETGHDLVAELRVFASQCGDSGPFVHLGATSSDIEDNADALRIRESLSLVTSSLKALLNRMAFMVEDYADLEIPGFTHLQPAETTTLGYRMAIWSQDLLEDYKDLMAIKDEIKLKGFKGPVGTSASYVSMSSKKNARDMESIACRKLGMDFFMVAAQTYPRRQDYKVLSALSSLACSMAKMSLDLRLMQSPLMGGIKEPFRNKQVGSSAMPFKQNPIISEKVCSLSRMVAANTSIAWQNASLSMLDRTLDDSANRRAILPESFLAIDEMLICCTKVMHGLTICEEDLALTVREHQNSEYFSRVLNLAAANGIDRAEAHSALSTICEEARQKGWNSEKRISAIKSCLIFSSIKVWSTDIFERTEGYSGLAETLAKDMSTIIKIRCTRSH